MPKQDTEIGLLTKRNPMDLPKNSSKSEQLEEIGTPKQAEYNTADPFVYQFIKDARTDLL